MSDRSPSTKRSNFLAVTIAAFTIAFFHLSDNPEIVGADPEELRSSPPLLALTPVIQGDVGDSAEETHKQSDQAATAEKEKQPEGRVVRGRMAVLMNLLMLQKARAVVAMYPEYSIRFHKHERIDGDMQKPQVIQMKVRHEPFSVYMKWKVGDKGRQLLFVPGQHDDKMLVRMGGIKGRLLGTLKVDPYGPQAMADSRHPVTRAGLLGMIDEMIAHRKHDLSTSEVDAQVTANVKVNDVNCYRFLARYRNPKASKSYRKSVVYLDAEKFLPVAVTNYTWARDAGDIEEAELDQQTLIENYAFSELIVQQAAVAENFNAGNKRYRF